MRGRQLLFDQTLDVLVRRLLDQRFRASPAAVTKGRLPLPDEASYDHIDGGSRAEKHSADLGRRTTFSAEQHYVHPQPPARLPFALHLSDEVLAFFRSEGDTLHLGGCLFRGWLDLASLPCHTERPPVQLSCASHLGVKLRELLKTKLQGDRD